MLKTECCVQRSDRDHVQSQGTLAETTGERAGPSAVTATPAHSGAAYGWEARVTIKLFGLIESGFIFSLYNLSAAVHV